MQLQSQMCRKTPPGGDRPPGDYHLQAERENTIWSILTQISQPGGRLVEEPRDILTTIDDRMMATMMITMLKQ